MQAPFRAKSADSGSHFVTPGAKLSIECHLENARLRDEQTIRTVSATVQLTLTLVRSKEVLAFGTALAFYSRVRSQHRRRIMKQLTNSKSNVAAAVVAVLTSTIFLLPRAVQYTHAARRDERKGFAYTAAMEWRHAAELFDPNTVPADYCWRQWERIIHLPRRLAGTIREAPLGSACASRLRNNPVAYDMPISTAA